MADAPSLADKATLSIDGNSHDRSRASSATMIVSRTVSAGYRRAD